jgi:hypothetical protein
MFNAIGWNFDQWLAVIGLVIGVVGFLFAYFAITSERVASFLIQWHFREMPTAFQQMATEYRRADLIPDDLGPITLPPSETRVRRKDVLAQGLGAYALARNLDRAALAKGDDGYIAALMKLIVFEPRRGDAALIVKAAKTNVPPHTDFLTLAAISALSRNGLIREDQRGPISEALECAGARLRAEHQTAVDKVRVALREA